MAKKRLPNAMVYERFVVECPECAQELLLLSFPRRGHVVVCPECEKETLRVKDIDCMTRSDPASRVHVGEAFCNVMSIKPLACQLSLWPEIKPVVRYWLVCGRPLVSVMSRERGVGPRCARRNVVAEVGARNDDGDQSGRRGGSGSAGVVVQ